jgi:hypothetical protein
VRRPQFEAYLEKVFAFPTLMAQLSDRRRAPHHACHTVFEALFFGAALRIPSLHHLEHECRTGVLRWRIGPISEDTFRYALQRLDLEALAALWAAVAKRLKRNGILRTEASRGLVVAAVDGIELCHSLVRCCAACLVRSVQRHVDGESRLVTEYYHRLVVVAVVSTPFPIPLGLRFQQPGEGEVECALALLRALTAHLGRRFVDVLVGDALYCTTPVVQAVEDLGLDWVFTVKDNQPGLMEEVDRLTRGLPTDLRLEPDQQWQLWHVPEAFWAAADRTVRIVKTTGKALKQRLTIQGQGARRTPVKAPRWEHHTQVYATNLALLDIPPVFVEELGQSRWRIDTEVFQVLTTACSFKRPSVHASHDQALVALTMIRVLAYVLTLVFFHQQVLSHCRRHRPGYCYLARALAAGYTTAFHDSS